MVRARIARVFRDLAGIRGWQSLVNTLVPDHSAAFTIRNGDVVVSGDIGSFVDRQVYLFGGYEATLIECFLSHVPAGRSKTILDIGANVGTHSLAFARVFEIVHAFEPNPMLWNQFERNMELNGLANVRLHKLGLADRDAQLTLYMENKPNYGEGAFATVEQYELPLRPVATCPVRHAGNFLAEIGVGPVDAVKIDVQGFEPEVLRGLTDVLKRDRPVIWCEIGAGTLTKVDEIGDLAALIPFEFRCYQLESDSFYSTRLRERKTDLPGGDYMLIPD